jgi:hypothetical protein
MVDGVCCYSCCWMMVVMVVMVVMGQGEME